MTRAHGAQSGRQCARGNWRGSAVIFALFACLVASMAVQMLAAAVICGHRAIAEETMGRELLTFRDECLVQLMEKAGSDWSPSEIGVMEVEGSSMSALLTAGAEGYEWALSAQAYEQAGFPALRTSVLVERGRDGLDLPLAALVADRVRADPARIDPWISVNQGTGYAYVREVQGAVAVGEGCVVLGLEATWTLGEGWRNLLTHSDAWQEDCVIITGDRGLVVRAPEEIEDASPDHPALLVVAGGAALDLRDLGEVWATIVVDQGSLWMEGTVVRGALFATGDVDMGTIGQVVYEGGVLQWARDRSLTRTRLVPGSRREVIE